jgi:prolyl-tRNA editing enzyme YbaK/EbsC (Cys-tRNA(Pro) deacylase)
VGGPTAVTAGNEALEAAVAEVLDRTGVPYELLPCDPDLADTAAFCAHYGWSPEMSANTILVASKKGEKRYAACVVTATTRVDVNRTVKRLMGVSKASFAPPEETSEVTGMIIGGVTPLALPEGLPIFVDARVMAQPEIILGGGSRSMKVKVSPEVFHHLPAATVVEGLAYEA